MKPLLFVDVDGVVNILGPEVRYRETKVVGRRLRYDPHIGARLQRLSKQFEPVWATAWGRDARKLHRLIGTGDWPVLPFVGNHKLPAIRRYAGSRRWAWVDDHAFPSPDGLSLLVNPRLGLTDGDVDRLLSYARSR